MKQIIKSRILYRCKKKEFTKIILKIIINKGKFKIFKM